jgi:cyclopropane-fatty-acyl-phospholipid synthase
MLPESVVRSTVKERKRLGLPTMAELVHFILDEVVPGGWSPTVATVEERAAKAGFRATRMRPLRLHYARTLDMWTAALEANEDQAIALHSHEVDDRYMK